jgi:hypothetical protein
MLAQSNFGFGYIGTYGERKLGLKDDWVHNPYGRFYVYLLFILIYFY